MVGGAIVTTALLLLGLSFISSSYQPAIAQQDMTMGSGGATTDSGTEGGTTGGATPQDGNATTPAAVAVVATVGNKKRRWSRVKCALCGNIIIHAISL